MNSKFISICLLMFYSLQSIETMCLGLLCSVVPLVSKSCCSVFEKCCIQYHAWLAPLIGSGDVMTEYVNAVAGDPFDDTITFNTRLKDAHMLAYSQPYPMQQLALQ